MIDWGAGEYEHTAADLMPVAERLAKLAGFGPDDRVLDLGCGTGNVALLAARAGAEVTAVDPAPRLLEVARERLTSEGLDADFVPASAEDLPFPDGEFDVVTSCFAVIFAEDVERAAAQIVRVLDEEGRAFVTAWLPTGPLFEAFEEMGARLAALAPEEPAPRFAWDSPDAVTALFDAAGAEVQCTQATLTFPASSAENYMERFESVHPVGMSMRAALTAAGDYDEPRAQALKRIGAGLEGGGIESTYLTYLITH